MKYKLYKLALWYIGKCNKEDTSYKGYKKEIKELDKLTFRCWGKANLLYGLGAEWENFRRYDVLDNAIQRLAEYEALGTVEELKKAREKQSKFGKDTDVPSKWIPCEERLPENLEQVLVWYEYFRYGDYNCMYETYGIGYHLDGFWSGDVSGHKARCIAWQPLPKEYKKEN